MSLSRARALLPGARGLALLTGVAVLAACGSSAGTTATPATSAPSVPSSEAPSTSATPSSSASPDAAGADAPGTVAFRDAVPGSGDGLKLGFIALGDSQVPFSKLVTDSMKAEAKGAGADLIVCDSALDGAKALACAQSFKTQGVQAYLNFQVDAKVSSAICAQGPQVPVIAVDIEQQPCQIAFMGASNDRAGYLAGKAVGDYAKAKFDCKYDAYVSMEQPAAGAVNDARMGGYRKGFSEVCGEITNARVVDGGGALDGARTKFADVLTSLPGAKKIIVVGINDDSILGAVAAAKTANRGDSIFVSGQGADPSSWCEIKNNPNWVADTAYFPEKYGKIGVPYLIDAAKGKTIPKELLVPHQVLDSKNITDFYPTAGQNCS